MAELDNLPVGGYYIVEIETSHGYVLDNEPRYVDLTYRDQDTPLLLIVPTGRMRARGYRWKS